METNYNEVLSKNIQNLRKANNMTQEELASICNISFQAISKWENNLTSPDISLLPVIAKTFKCSIDSLFSSNPEVDEDQIGEDDIRVVVYLGKKKILSKDPLTEEIEIDLKTKVNNFYSYGDLSYSGKLEVSKNLEITGDINCDNINCGGNIQVGGEMNADDIKCTPGVLGNYDISAGGDITADNINCGGVTVGGDFTADDVSCGGVTVGGDITADNISCGGVSCRDISTDSLSSGGVKCNNIDGETISTGGMTAANITTTKLKTGDLTCKGDLEAETIECDGDINCYGSFEVSGNVRAKNIVEK